MTWSYVPPEVLRHVLAVLATLVLAFACAFAVVWAKERRRLPAPRGSGPISLAWKATLGLATLLILSMLLGLWLHRPWHWKEVETDPGGHEVYHTLGMIVLKVPTLLLPLLATLIWSWALRRAWRRDSPPSRHSPVALGALLLSGAALGIFLALYGIAWI